MGMHNEKPGPLGCGPGFRGLQEKNGKKGREMLVFHFTRTNFIKQEQTGFKKAIW